MRTPAMFDEAQLVVRETMTIIRENIEVLIRGLQRHGFQFGVYPDGEEVPGYDGPLIPPASSVERQIAELETLCGGPVPLSLAGFWRYVGSVKLVGTFPDWPEGSDPLWVEGPQAGIDELDDRDEDGEPFDIPIAPDALHKDNISGGPPYAITLPDPAVDAILREEGNNLYFVEYLRQALDWGGFPGFANAPDAMPGWLDKLSESMRRF